MPTQPMSTQLLAGNLHQEASVPSLTALAAASVAVVSLVAAAGPTNALLEPRSRNAGDDKHGTACTALLAWDCKWWGTVCALLRALTFPEAAAAADVVLGAYPKGGGAIPWAKPSWSSERAVDGGPRPGAAPLALELSAWTTEKGMGGGSSSCGEQQGYEWQW